MMKQPVRAVGSWVTPERRPLAILLGTGFISLISNQLTSLAVPWFVLVLTGSATKMGITAIATMLPSVVMMLLGGAIADRVSPRKLSAFSDVLSGVTVALVPLLYALGFLNFSLLIVLMVIGALFDTPGYAARSKLVPQLAERGQIQIERVTSLQGIFQAISVLFGAVLAGVLITALGATNVLWFNAAAFALSAITMLTLIPEMHTPRENLPSVAEDIRVGLRYVRSHTLLMPLILGALAINALSVPLPAVLFPYLAKTVWNSATAYGVLISAIGAGAIVGSTLFGTLGERLPRSLILKVSVSLLSLPIFALVPLPALPIAWIAVFLSGVGAGLVNPMVSAMAFRITDSAILGRVMGVINAGALIASPLGVLVAAPVLERYGLATSFLVLGIGLTLTAVGIVLSPIMREIDKIDAHSERTTIQMQTEGTSPM